MITNAVVSEGISRRTFLRAAGASIITGSALLLAACSSASAPSVTPAASTAESGARLPIRVPLPNVTAELPGTETVQDGFLTYPKNPVKSVSDTPASGGDLTWMVFSGTPTAALADNPAWQEVNKQVGANLKMQITPFSDYKNRQAVVLAGNDIPDAMFLSGVVPEQAQLLRAKFTDLTPFLAGDAIKAYPNLANMPAIAWKNAVFNGAIYAVPSAHRRYFNVLWARQEMLDTIGAPLPASADEFKRVLKDLTSPNNGVWGIASNVGTAYDLYNGLHSAMFGAPNRWAESGGKFTSTYETDQFKAAVGFARELYAANYYHPNYYNDTLVKRNDFEAGKFAFQFDGMTLELWNGSKKVNPATKLRLPLPPGGDNSKGHYWYGSGSFGLTVIKQASPDRIKEILRIMNYFAAPFGSEEYLLTHYGVKGIDYDLDADGNPQLNQKGATDTMPWVNPVVPTQVQVLYNPPDPDMVKVIHADETAMDPYGVSDPTIGLFSRTDAAKRAVLDQAMIDGMTAIVRGEDPMSKYDELVRDWRSNGGDQTRSEFEEDFAASRG